jgi:prophage DNA circulation protein
MVDRDALLGALQEEGPGELVHPYLGRIQVVIDKFNLRESAEDGRIARFQISCIEAGLQRFPARSIDTNTALTGNADSLISAGQSRFALGAVMNDVPDFVRGGATTPVSFLGRELKQLVDAGNLVNATVSAVVSGQDYINTSASLSRGLFNMINPLPSLVSDALTFGSFVSNTIGLINSISGDGTAARKVLRATREIEAAPVTEYTDSEVQQNANEVAVIELIEVIGIAEEAKATLNIDYNSRADAIAVRDDIVDQIDYLMEKVTSDDTFSALSALKFSIVQTIPPADQDLPDLQTIRLNSTTPTLVLSYDLYETVANEAEIIDRNGVKHPGFVEADVPLEVLVSG